MKYITKKKVPTMAPFSRTYLMLKQENTIKINSTLAALMQKSRMIHDPESESKLQHLEMLHF